MKTLDNTCFNVSGCLTGQALTDFVYDRMGDTDRVLVEGHIDTCPLCADAVEGVSLLQTEKQYHENVHKLHEWAIRNKKQITGNLVNQRGSLLVAAASIAAAIVVMIYIFNTFHEIEVNTPVSAFEGGVMDLYPVGSKPAPPKGADGFAMPVSETDKAGNVYFESASVSGKKENRATSIQPQQPIGNKPVSTKRWNISALRTMHQGSKKMENKPVQEFQLIFPVDKPRYGYSDNGHDVVVARFIEKGIKEAYTLPSFQTGGVEPFLIYIKKNIRYPQEAIDKDIAGIVMVDFTINEYGKLIGARISRGVHPLLDNEALRVISESPGWLPGRSDGRVTSVNFTCPVVFKLSK